MTLKEMSFYFLSFLSREISFEMSIGLIGLGIGLIGASAFGVVYAATRKRKAFLEEEIFRINNLIMEHEEEKKKIANDLRERIGQLLFAFRLNFENLSEELKKKNPSQTEQIKSTKEILDNACKELNSLAQEVMPRALKEAGLAEAIEDMLVKTFHPTVFNYDFTHFGMKSRFDEKIEIAVYRILQEVLKTLISRAESPKIFIQLFKAKNSIVLITEDSGEFLREKDFRQTIFSRLESVNGKFSLQKGVKSGNIISIRIPLKNQKNYIF